MSNHNYLSLKLIQRCPACNAAFQQTQVTVLMESELGLLAHLHCANCQVNLLANVVNAPQGLTGNAILTDLTASEAAAAINSEGFSEDDFLHLFKEINNKKIINNLRNSGLSTDHPRHRRDQNDSQPDKL